MDRHNGHFDWNLIPNDMAEGSKDDTHKRTHTHTQLERYVCAIYRRNLNNRFVLKFMRQIWIIRNTCITITCVPLCWFDYGIITITCGHVDPCASRPKGPDHSNWILVPIRGSMGRLAQGTTDHSLFHIKWSLPPVKSVQGTTTFGPRIQGGLSHGLLSPFGKMSTGFRWPGSST